MEMYCHEANPVGKQPYAAGPRTRRLDKDYTNIEESCDMAKGR